ncbi:hypothetical protein HYS30_01995 [Candidatus Peregrinibacteria bacterium]|nr:hypothetical protein [Candidatus Peregrinibacteria bacterium]
MTPRDIIANAWQITIRETPLRRWGFAQTLLETLLEAKLVFYQIYFVYKYMQEGEGAGFFDIEAILYKQLPLWLFLLIIITFMLMVLIEIFLPKMCLGAVIGLAAKSYRKEEMRGGLVLALYNFWPIFAIQEVFLFSSITTAITVISLSLRYGTEGLRFAAIGFIIFFFLFSNILKFFASFAEEAIVIRKVGTFSAVGQSFKLVVSYLSHVMFLLLLLLMISLRIAMNAVTILFIPVIAIGLGLLLPLFLPSAISYAIAAMATIVTIVFVSYLLTYLHVFKQTVWTITYLELSAKKDLDVILPSS